MRRWRRLAGLGVLALLPAGALAHHGFTGRYDASTPVVLSGGIETVYIGLPHPEIGLRVAGTAPPDLPETLGRLRDGTTPAAAGATLVEFPPTAAFFALDGRVAPGDSVTIIALRNCDPPGQLRGQAILAGGVWTVAEGRVQDEVAAC